MTAPRLARSRTALAALASLALAAALAPSACGRAAPPGGTSDDAGNGSDAGRDSGTVTTGDGGAPLCTSDSQCGAKRYCEKTTGICRDAKPCPQGQQNCGYPGDDYCGNSLCFCDPADSSCKPVHRACDGCQLSYQCGNTNYFDFPADCLPASAGYADAGACIPRKDFGCPPGYQYPTDGGVYCSPAGGRCGAGGSCTTSADCDPHGKNPECDAQHGVCVPSCSFDLKTAVSTPCPSGTVCHVDPRLLALQPSEANWAHGSCRPPCSADSDCDGGLGCRSEGVDTQVKRCTIKSGCLGDIECPPNAAAHSYGYCDLASTTCAPGCRTREDCFAGYICAQGQCVAETCLEAGGASLACDYGQFCCGESGGPACPAGDDAGVCYDAPKQTWCGTCSADSDCRTSSYPQKSGAPNVCVDPGSGTKVCWLGCDPAGPLSQCPRSWQCQPIVVGCQQQSDCQNNGVPSTAKCDNPDGGGGSCACSADADCPQDAQSGFASHCYKGHCTVTTACRPACQ